MVFVMSAAQEALQGGPVLVESGREVFCPPILYSDYWQSCFGDSNTPAMLVPDLNRVIRQASKSQSGVFLLPEDEKERREKMLGAFFDAEAAYSDSGDWWRFLAAQVELNDRFLRTVPTRTRSSDVEERHLTARAARQALEHCQSLPGTYQGLRSVVERVQANIDGFQEQLLNHADDETIRLLIEGLADTDQVAWNRFCSNFPDLVAKHSLGLSDAEREYFGGSDGVDSHPSGCRRVGRRVARAIPNTVVAVAVLASSAVVVDQVSHVLESRSELADIIESLTNRISDYSGGVTVAYAEEGVVDVEEVQQDGLTSTPTVEAQGANLRKTPGIDGESAGTANGEYEVLGMYSIPGEGQYQNWFLVRSRQDPQEVAYLSADIGLEVSEGPIIDLNLITDQSGQSIVLRDDVNLEFLTDRLRQAIDLGRLSERQSLVLLGQREGAAVMGGVIENNGVQDHFVVYLYGGDTPETSGGVFLRLIDFFPDGLDGTERFVVHDFNQPRAVLLERNGQILGVIDADRLIGSGKPIAEGTVFFDPPLSSARSVEFDWENGTVIIDGQVLKIVDGVVDTEVLEEVEPGAVEVSETVILNYIANFPESIRDEVRARYEAGEFYFDSETFTLRDEQGRIVSRRALPQEEVYYFHGDKIVDSASALEASSLEVVNDFYVELANGGQVRILFARNPQFAPDVFFNARGEARWQEYLGDSEFAPDFNHLAGKTIVIEEVSDLPAIYGLEAVENTNVPIILYSGANDEHVSGVYLNNRNEEIIHIALFGHNTLSNEIAIGALVNSLMKMLLALGYYEGSLPNFAASSSSDLHNEHLESLLCFARIFLDYDLQGGESLESILTRAPFGWGSHPSYSS